MANGNSTNETISVSLPSWLIELLDSVISRQPLTTGRSGVISRALLNHLAAECLLEPRFLQLIKREMLGEDE